MPSALVKTIASETDSSVEDVEKVWDDLKKQYKDEGLEGDDLWQAVTGTMVKIYKKKGYTPEKKESMKLRPYTSPFLESRGRFYAGKPLETGGTSIAGGAAPPIKFLFAKGYIKPGMKVLDFGAGKYARNADFL
jgi:hypothetical protein